METISTILIYLFILSIITEKTVALIRNYPKKTQILVAILSFYLFLVSIISFFESKYLLRYVILSLLFLAVFLVIVNLGFISLKAAYGGFGMKNPFGNIGKGKKVEDTVQKAKEITLLSFLVGTFIAFFANASLFNLLTTNPESLQTFANQDLFSKWYLFNHNSSFDIVGFIGLLTTGLFLSFGSKFFHDLLELLFHIKDAKERLAAPETFQAGSMVDLESELVLGHDDIVKAFFHRKNKEVLNIEGVNGISLSTMMSEGERQLGVKITTTKPDLIKTEQFRYKKPGGEYYQIPLKVVTSDIAQSCQGITPSEKIRNKASSHFGTLCFPVIDDEQIIYFLTCYHVVKHDDHSWERFRIKGIEDVANGNGNRIGRISNVCFNAEIDAAIIEKDAAIDINQIDTSVGSATIEKKKIINSNDVNSLQILFKGAASLTERSGFITGMNSVQIIRFQGITKTFSNLIELQDEHGKPLAQSGDSGSLVYTSKGEAIGMILATDNNESFAIPIDSILSEFDVKLL